MKRLVAFLFIGIASAAIGQELQKFENCSLVEAGWADGDSFPVKLPDGREIILRLYYVDCNENSAT
jgi:endonuclease YncB( thermonuclease family)